MRVLITGAGGFVGSRLVRHLLADGCEVARFVLAAEDGGAAEHSRTYVGDLCDRSSIAHAISDFEPEAVAHLGGLSDVAASWQHVGEYFRVNVLGTKNVVTTVPAGCRVVFASSADVYGCVSEDDLPISEQLPARPASPYGMSKAASELLAVDAGAVIVRSFNLIGPGQGPRFALPSFALQLAEIAAGRAESRLEVGNLSARRDFLHVDDGVAAYALLLRRGEAGATYNLASGQSTEVKEALRRLIEISGLTVEVRVSPERFRPVDTPELCGDPSRLRALGWNPTLGLTRALEDLWATVRPTAVRADGAPVESGG